MNTREGTTSTSWLLVIRTDGVIESVDGGAPVSWVTRNLFTIPELACATGAVAELQSKPPTLLRRAFVALDTVSKGVTCEILMVEALPLRRAHTPINDLILRTLDAFMTQAKSSDVDLRVEQDSNVPPVFFIDGQKVSWALATLVGNALRFAQIGSRKKDAHVHVRIAWDEATHELLIRVDDNGPGMPEHRSRWLFETDPADGQSAGLALLMVRDVVVAHRGSIAVKSAMGQGTTFSLRIPRVQIAGGGGGRQ